MPRAVIINRCGARQELDMPSGLSLLEIARAHGIDIEGRCEGSLACSTCHVVIDPDTGGRHACHHTACGQNYAAGCIPAAASI